MSQWGDLQKLQAAFGDPQDRTIRYERDRYRAALEQIASCDSVVTGDCPDLARKALAPEMTREDWNDIANGRD